MLVTNLVSSAGNAVANQFKIETVDGTFYQSYRSMIVFIPSDSSQKIELGADWDYSKTTSKYRNQFLGLTTPELKKKIASGEIVINENL